MFCNKFPDNMYSGIRMSTLTSRMKGAACDWYPLRFSTIYNDSLLAVVEPVSNIIMDFDTYSMHL